MFTIFLFLPNSWTTSYKTFFFFKTVPLCNPAWPRTHNIPASVSQGYGYSCILAPTFG